MEDLCRICRKNCHFNPIPLLSDHDGVPLKQMLTKTCPIDITFDDPIGQLLPQSICTDCLEVVTAAYNLQQVCIESDQYFRSLVSSDQIVVKTEKMDIKEEEVDTLGSDDCFEEQETEHVAYLVPVQKKRKLVSASTAFNPRLTQNPQKKSDPQYECNFCMLLFKEKFQAIKHMRQEHDPIQLPFGCDFCTARFKNKPQRSLHETVRHAGEIPVAVSCPICGINGVSEDGMQRHLMDDHKEYRDEDQTSKAKRVDFHPRPAVQDSSSESLQYEDTWYLCNFCDKKMKPKMSLLRHMRKHCSSAYPFGCEFCIMRFDDRGEFEAHVKYVHELDTEKSTLFCDLCGASGDNKPGMQHHMIDDHLRKSRHKKASKNYKCTVCGAKFMQNLGLSMHMITKHGEMTKCDKCDETLQSKVEMDHHMMMVHEKLYRELEQDEIEVSLKCCLCEVNHETEDQLMDHLDTHKDVFTSERTRCHLCPKILPDFQQFIVHAKYHAEPQTHECLTCRKRLPFGEKLVIHVKNHKRYDCYKVECKKCKQVLRSAKDLEIHDKVKHQNETLFMCPICARSLSTANGLDQHIRYVHNKEKEMQFKCKSCPMSFVYKTKLTRHEAIHSTERPHVCEVCGSSFKLQAGLAKHMKIHNGTLVKKHACTQCTSKFTSRYRLDRHMLTHTGQKPHECKFCDRAYASKGDLTKHMQKLHVGDAVYQCEKCPKAFRLIVELREHLIEHAGH